VAQCSQITTAGASLAQQQALRLHNSRQEATIVNIFAVDLCPITTAQMLCDHHVVKMTLESAQMLSTIQRLHGNADERLYKPTHSKHPCTLWAQSCTSNYYWLHRHFHALGNEYTYRFGKQHKSHVTLVALLSKAPVSLQRCAHITPFALAMPAEIQQQACGHSVEESVRLYRLYYATKRDGMQMRYTKRTMPQWLTRGL
jgi:hypothetical protein